MILISTCRSAFGDGLSFTSAWLTPHILAANVEECLVLGQLLYHHPYSSVAPRILFPPPCLHLEDNAKIQKRETQNKTFSNLFPIYSQMLKRGRTCCHKAAVTQSLCPSSCERFGVSSRHGSKQRLCFFVSLCSVYACKVVFFVAVR